MAGRQPAWASVTHDGIRVHERPSGQDVFLWAVLVVATIVWTVAVVSLGLTVTLDLQWLCMAVFVPFLWAVVVGVGANLFEKRDLLVSAHEVVVRRTLLGRERVARFPLATVEIEPFAVEGGKGSLSIGIVLREAGREHRLPLPGARTLPEHDRVREELAWVVATLEKARAAAVPEDPDAMAELHAALQPVRDRT